MLPILLVAQVAALVAPRDSVYDTPALRALIARAAVANHAPPPTFRGYRARVETELSLLLHDTLGRERSAQIEQLASSVRWTRDGSYEMRVIGYRAQGVGVPYSSLSFIRGWTEPSLYGQRLRLGAEFGSARDRASSSRSEDSLVVVHPLATDRESYYRFTGGDTITVLRAAGRAIPIIRVLVTPHLRDSTRYGAFHGEIDLDATRHEIVRMRGQFVVLGTPPRRPSLVARLGGVVAVAYCEFVNTEVNGRYWLPATQRTELQSTVAMLGRSRAVMRIVSRFTGYSVDDSSAAVGIVDVGERGTRRTTWAPSDSVSDFSAWSEPLGSATTSVSSSDFDDIAPDVWRATGNARADLLPTKLENVLRYNRVEGLFTGLEGTLRMRSDAPGLTVGATAGWAWTERTWRGAARLGLARGTSTTGVSAERALASTNDFAHPLAPRTGGIAAFLASVDDFDYVDRRTAVVSHTRLLGSLDVGLVSVQAGVGDDRAEPARRRRGVAGSREFRPNRAAKEGGYALMMADLEWHPNVTGQSVQPGVGGRIHTEVGRGTLSWQRAEAAVSGRATRGRFMLSLNGDAGLVAGRAIPPQRLLELGGQGTLPGYRYKAYAGDRAAIVRAQGSVDLGWSKVPRRIWRSLFLPGVSPALAVSVQSGWTSVSSAAGRVAVAALGTTTSGEPLAGGSGGARTSVGAGLTLFGGNAHAGVVKRLEPDAPWRMAVGLGQGF